MYICIHVCLYRDCVGAYRRNGNYPQGLERKVTGNQGLQNLLYYKKKDSTIPVVEAV